MTVPPHVGRILALRFDAAGRLLSASEDGSARVFAITGRETSPIHTLGGHFGAVRDVGVLRDGTIVTVSVDCGVRLFSAQGTLLRLLKGHTSAVTCLAIAPSGTHFATASDDGSVRAWDAVGERIEREVASGSIEREVASGSIGVLGGHREGAAGVWFLDDERILTAPTKGEARVWTPRKALIAPARRTRRIANLLRAQAPHTAISPNGEHKASIVDADVLIRAVGKRAVLARHEGHGRSARSLGFIDDNTLWLACDDGTVRCLALTDRHATTLVLHDDVITAVAVSADGALIASGAADGSVQVSPRHTPGAGSRPSKPSHSVRAGSVERLWSKVLETDTMPDARFERDVLWVGRADQLFGFDVKTGEPVGTIAGTGDVVAFGDTSVVFAEYDQAATVVDRRSGAIAMKVPLEGNYLRPPHAINGPLAWITRRKKHADHLKVLDPERRAVSRSFGPMKHASDTFAFGPNGTRLAVASEEPSLWLWDVATQALVATPSWKSDDEGAFALAFTADGRRLIVGTRDGRALVFNAVSGAFERELIPPSRGAAYDSWTPVFVSPTSDRVVVHGDDNRHALLFDLGTGELVARLFGEESSGWISGNLAFSPDGTRLIAKLSHKPKLCFFDAKTGSVVATHSVHDGGELQIRFFNKGTHVLTYGTDEGDRSLRAFDVATGARRWVHLGMPGEELTYVVFSPDGKMVAVCANGSATVRLLALDDGRTLADLGGHTEYVREPAFSPDSRFLATGSNDQRVQVWRL